MKSILFASVIVLSKSMTMRKAMCGVQIYDPTTTGCCNEQWTYDLFKEYCCAKLKNTNPYTLKIYKCNEPQC